MNKIFTMAVVSMMLLVFASAVAAQGSDPERETRRRKKSTPTVPTTPKQTPRVTSRPKTTPKTARPGTIHVTVNETDTEIFLENSAGESSDEETSFFASPGLPHVFRNLRAGSYTLTARKPGYGEVKRSIVVAAGGTYPIDLVLKSSMNFLTVTTNAENAEIVIEGVGTYNGEVRNLALRPGVYTISASRLGHIRQTKSVTLSDPPRGTSLEIFLPPVPINSMLDDAAQKIAAGEHSQALALATEVLAIDVAHGRANYIAGLANFHMGQVRSATLFLRAISAGYKISVPVSVMYKAGNGSGIAKVNLLLDRNYLYIEGGSRAELNFTLFKPDVKKIAGKHDRYATPRVEIDGKGESNGRRDDRELALYSQSTLLRPNHKETFCSQPVPCSRDTTLLLRLVHDWQTKLR